MIGLRYFTLVSQTVLDINKKKDLLGLESQFSNKTITDIWQFFFGALWCHQILSYACRSMTTCAANTLKKTHLGNHNHLAFESKQPEMFSECHHSFSHAWLIPHSFVASVINCIYLFYWKAP